MQTHNEEHQIAGFFIVIKHKIYTHHITHSSMSESMRFCLSVQRHFAQGC